MIQRILTSLLIVAAGLMFTGCGNGNRKLSIVANFGGRQCTGVAVAHDGRVFVNFPRWAHGLDASVVEVLPDGRTRPFPNEQWNRWNAETDPQQRFVCVQSVWIDTTDPTAPLWVLDSASPFMEGAVPNGSKLAQVDLDTNRVTRVIRFDRSIAPEDSYLNDVRVDSERGFAYITDSGSPALIVVNLNTGRSRRVLEGHASTTAEDVTPVIGRRELRATDGTVPRIHADGIALSPDGQQLYFKPLTGRTLYRIPTAKLRNFSLSEDLLAEGVEALGEVGVCDGMLLDRENRLYVTALEEDAILQRLPDGTLQRLIADERLNWPDSLAIGPEGALYITISQIHEAPRFNDGDSLRTEPYRLLKLDNVITPAETEEPKVKETVELRH